MRRWFVLNTLEVDPPLQEAIRRKDRSYEHKRQAGCTGRSSIFLQRSVDEALRGLKRGFYTHFRGI